MGHETGHCDKQLSEVVTASINPERQSFETTVSTPTTPFYLSQIKAVPDLETIKLTSIECSRKFSDLMNVGIEASGN